jgi:NADH dehydrogenase FAD-containing subunit
VLPPARILLIGGGQVGVNAALRLRSRLRPGEAEVTLVDPTSYMTYQPFLAEAAAGAIDPRHVVVPLRRALPGVRIVQGRLASLDTTERRAHLVLPSPLHRDGPTVDMTVPYDRLVLAPGSISRILPVPGLARHGIGFRSVQEAVKLRNHVLGQLDAAASTRDPEVRHAALTFVFVGGGYAGTGAVAELEDMARHALTHYPTIRPEDLRWILVEAGKRILPEAEPQAAERTTAELRERAVDVRLGTRLAAVGPDGLVQLTDGSRFAARTLVWTAGVRANPVLKQTRAGSAATPGCASSAPTMSSPRATAPRSLISPAPARPAVPTRSTPCARPPCWPTTSWPACAASRRWSTGTNSRARSPHSACTRAWPSCADAPCTDAPPGCCTGPCTCAASPPGSARRASCPTGCSPG